MPLRESALWDCLCPVIRVSALGEADTKKNVRGGCPQCLCLSLGSQLASFPIRRNLRLLQKGHVVDSSGGLCVSRDKREACLTFWFQKSMRLGPGIWRTLKYFILGYVFCRDNGNRILGQEDYGQGDRDLLLPASSAVPLCVSEGVSYKRQASASLNVATTLPSSALLPVVLASAGYFYLRLPAQSAWEHRSFPVASSLSPPLLPPPHPCQRRKKSQPDGKDKPTLSDPARVVSN